MDWSQRIENSQPADRNAILDEATNSEDATVEHLEKLFNLGAMIVSMGKQNDTALEPATPNEGTSKNN